MSIPANLKYTEDHEWLRIEGNEAVIGITDFAQSNLGDIVYIDVNTVGQKLDANAVFGSVEAVKTVADLFLPIAGTITAINPNLDSAPETVNTDPYGAGWIIKVKPSDPAEQDVLLNAADYKTMIGK